MVIVIEPERHAEFSFILEKSYEMRARVIRRWGWNVPDMDPHRDCDSFDNDRTVYFIDVDDDEPEKVVGTARFNPTMAPHLLSEVFPHMCEFDGVIRCPVTWESTRYIIDTHAVEEWQSLRSRSRLAYALNEYAITNGIRRMSWLTTVPLYRRMKALWPTKPLGLPLYHKDDDNTYIAAVSELTEEASDTLLGMVSKFPGGVGAVEEYVRA
ncbi:MAG: acyl-homoserine-lactone synthase [Pseudomonadota bacterium]